MPSVRRRLSFIIAGTGTEKNLSPPGTEVPVFFGNVASLADAEKMYVVWPCV
ncbi:MAG: hypothetical protein GY820_32155 [Gammaproteobacteria bacterium]|nr:hypothetical protein [Gammaproteobacteria bacterium]